MLPFLHDLCLTNVESLGGGLEMRRQPARAITAQTLGERGGRGVFQPVPHVDERGLGAVEGAGEGSAAEEEDMGLDGELSQRDQNSECGAVTQVGGDFAEEDVIKTDRGNEDVRCIAIDVLLDVALSQLHGAHGHTRRLQSFVSERRVL